MTACATCYGTGLVFVRDFDALEGSKRITCPRCLGSGGDGLARPADPATCGACRGFGYTVGPDGGQRTCRACLGTGNAGVADQVDQAKAKARAALDGTDSLSRRLKELFGEKPSAPVGFQAIRLLEERDPIARARRDDRVHVSSREHRIPLTLGRGRSLEEWATRALAEEEGQMAEIVDELRRAEESERRERDVTDAMVRLLVAVWPHRSPALPAGTVWHVTGQGVAVLDPGEAPRWRRVVRRWEAKHATISATLVPPNPHRRELRLDELGELPGVSPTGGPHYHAISRDDWRADNEGEA